MLRSSSALVAVGRGLWCSVAAALGLAGIAGGYLLMGTGDAGLLAALTALVAVSIGWMLRSVEPQRRQVPPLPLLGVAGGGTGLAVIGLVLELGAAGLLVAGVVAAVGWPLLRRGRDPARRDDDVVATRPVQRIGPVLEQVPQDPLPVLSGLCSLSTPDVCRTWQLTYTRLRRASSPAETEYLAELRRSCLVLLEQRDPEAFRRWFPYARAASDPARIFCPHPSPPPQPPTWKDAAP